MRFLLVHGGWQGGWCWDEVAVRLRAAGNSHNPMMDLNSDLVAERILSWLAER
jgi:hypothetical protein